MCGICGFVGYRDVDVLKRMSAVMVHRGPDDVGFHMDPVRQVGLGHRRLSIIDLSSAGHQPMANADGSTWISYNGEIYDFRDHRKELEGRGYRFRGGSDTEVVLALYECYGLDFLHRVNGMFALAIWDATQDQLVLARDHAGIKPLYYCQLGDSLFFASEIKALLQVPEIPCEVSTARVQDLLRFLWVPGRETMFRGIEKLEPGHYLVHKAGSTMIRRWFQIQYEPDYSVTKSQWQERVHATFQAVVNRQMVSDVPLGAFLSGGVDSSSIVAMMRRTHPDRPIACFTTQADSADWAQESIEDDYPYAQQVATLFHVDLRSIPLKPKLVDLLHKLVWHMDEPDADPAIIPSYLICQLARESGITVLLSGTGGDEVFFGYRSHLAYQRYRQLGFIPDPILWSALYLTEKLLALKSGAHSGAARRVRKFRAGVREKGLSRHCALVDWSSAAVRRQVLAGDVPAQESIPECLHRYYAELEGAGDLNRHSHLLVQTFLACHNFLYTDKTSMATSVEVRVPFMDVELMRLCATIPEEVKLSGGETKSLLKQTMERDLPRRILYRPKTGFGVPLRKWIREDLKDLIQDVLCESAVKRRGLLSPRGVQNVIEENRSGKVDHTYLIYSLLTLELWLRTYIDQRGRTAAS